MFENGLCGVWTRNYGLTIFFWIIYRYMIIHDCTVNHGIVVYVIILITLIMIMIIIIVIVINIFYCLFETLSFCGFG